jgi:hypothetical protein
LTIRDALATRGENANANIDISASALFAAFEVMSVLNLEIVFY